MTKAEVYRAKLRALPDWEPYLLKHSGLPGPRANLELAQIVADEAGPDVVEQLLGWDALRAPANDPHEFLALCGAVSLGRALAQGDRTALARLRLLAADPRWRIREGVAMALQHWGDVDMDSLFAAMKRWSQGKPYLQRAAAAAICEPRLLAEAGHARQALAMLDRITTSLSHERNRKSVDVIALKKALSYCWSVAVAALPPEGKHAMERWIATQDKDIRRIMLENLKKNRLARMDKKWVAQAAARVRGDE